MNQEKIGKFIAKLRKEKNLTQAELAEKLGVSDKSISRWENGNTMPDLSYLTTLADELDIEVSELLKGNKMTNEELLNLRNNIDNIINYSNIEKRNKAIKLNILFLIGLILILLGTLCTQYNILNNLFNNSHIGEGLSGAIYGLGIGFELIAFYNNNINLKK